MWKSIERTSGAQESGLVFINLSFEPTTKYLYTVVSDILNFAISEKAGVKICHIFT
jgi:hypothetical protein